VIAVISMMAGILLPVLENAQNSARSIICLNNTKQIGVAFAGYLTDYEGIYPPALWGSSVWANWKMSWMAMLAPYVGMDLGEGQSGWETVPEECVFRCSLTTYNQYAVYGVSYGYNDIALGQTNYSETTYWLPRSHPVRDTRFSRPSEQLVIGETWYADLNYSYRVRGNYLMRQQLIGFRHSRKAACGYADGHCEMEDQEWLWMSHPRGYPWNAQMENRDYYVYSTGRLEWDFVYGYEPFE
jgi:prepilin-type processing-associated H-X9-DG protein